MIYNVYYGHVMKVGCITCLESYCFYGLKRLTMDLRAVSRELGRCSFVNTGVLFMYFYEDCMASVSSLYYTGGG